MGRAESWLVLVALVDEGDGRRKDLDRGEVEYDTTGGRVLEEFGGRW